MDGLIIKHCFIFNPNLKSPKKKPSDDEAQDAKLLYYHPQDEETLIKRSNIGIIEGTLDFMEAFEKTNTQFLLTELNKFYYVANNYENDFLLVFILEKKQPMFSYYQDINTKKKWLKKVLDNYYDMFSLFHHSFTDFFLSKETPEVHLDLPQNKIAMLEDYTNSFFEYFFSMKLPFIDYLVYFPLHSSAQSNIILNIQRLNEKIPDMMMSAMIYKGYVVHNQLPLESFQLFYNLFYNVLDSSPRYNKFGQAPYVIHQTMGINEVDTKEKGESTNINDKSPFRKCFELSGGSTSDYLIGLRKSNVNNFQIFIPNIHIRQTDENFKLLVYYYNGLILFIFLKESFSIPNRLNNTLEKIKDWVDRYFKETILILEDSYKKKSNAVDFITYGYCNNANRSLKLCSQFINKKTRALDLEKFDILQKALLINSNVKMTSLTKFKGAYVYYMNSCERNVVMIYNDSISLPNLRKTIEGDKKELFDYIYII